MESLGCWSGCFGQFSLQVWAWSALGNLALFKMGPVIWVVRVNKALRTAQTKVQVLRVDRGKPIRGYKLNSTHKDTEPWKAVEIHPLPFPSLISHIK